MWLAVLKTEPRREGTVAIKLILLGIQFSLFYFLKSCVNLSPNLFMQLIQKCKVINYNVCAWGEMKLIPVAFSQHY